MVLSTAREDQTGTNNNVKTFGGLIHCGGSCGGATYFSLLWPLFIPFFFISTLKIIFYKLKFANFCDTEGVIVAQVGLELAR